jgi:plasmid replication initiation protein
MNPDRAKPTPERVTEPTPLEISRSLAGDPGAGDCPDLMVYPFFTLTHTRRGVPIYYRSEDLRISVDASAWQGLATIWDADVLIWAASQIINAREARTATSRVLAAHPSDILTFMGRGTSISDEDQLRGALARLQATSVAISICRIEGWREHQYSWISEWKEHTDSRGRSSRIVFMLTDWSYLGLLDSKLSLAVNPLYFTIKGGLDRWLYRLMYSSEPHGGQFEFLHLHGRSGTLRTPAAFAWKLRRIAAAQSLPGFELGVSRGASGQEILWFAPRQTATPPSLFDSIEDESWMPIRSQPGHAGAHVMSMGVCIRYTAVGHSTHRRQR